ncbi:MAG: hypothetical protein LBR07_10125 [Puniceicoccales bacterium]|jgi:hypothetical protein|nr:hypothetical protein [Puniceicoccales bacterium]
MSLSKSSRPAHSCIDAETRRLAELAWERWATSCCWFLARPNFETVGETEAFLRCLRKNGTMAAWHDARKIAARIS